MIAKKESNDEIVCLTLLWGLIDDEKFEGEEHICISLKKAIKYIEIKDESDSKIAYDYIVTKRIAERLKSHFKHQFNFKKYDYFVCSHSNYRCIDGKPVRFDP